MKIVIKDGLVVLSGENISYGDNCLLSAGIKYVDLTINNSTIVEDVELPENYIDGCFAYIKGSFVPTEKYEEAFKNLIEINEKKERELNNNQLLSEIANLEAQITPRRIREAILSGDNSFINNIEQQIILLRKQIL